MEGLGHMCESEISLQFEEQRGKDTIVWPLSYYKKRMLDPVLIHDSVLESVIVIERSAMMSMNLEEGFEAFTNGVHLDSLGLPIFDLEEVLADASF
jgi:hypothetical protein